MKTEQNEKNTRVIILSHDIGSVQEALRNKSLPVVSLYSPVLKALLELSLEKEAAGQEVNGGFVRLSVIEKTQEILGVSEKEFGRYENGEYKFRNWISVCLGRHCKHGLVESKEPRRFRLTKKGLERASRIRFSNKPKVEKPPVVQNADFLNSLQEAVNKLKQDPSFDSNNFSEIFKELVSSVRGEKVPWGQTETITPEKAAQLLEWNQNNRNLRKTRLDRYIKDMKEGSWKNTGQGIVLSKVLPDGSRRLLNGQHTLEAIIVSEIPQEILVVYDVPLENFPFLDKGKERDLADVLSAAGVRNSREIASMYAKLVEIKGSIGKIPDYDGHRCFRRRNTRPDAEMAIRWANENYEGFREAAKAVPNASILSPVSTFRALHFLFAKVDKEKADQFFECLVLGYGYEGETEQNPIYRLRMALERLRLRAEKVKGSKMSMAQQVGMTIKAWNAFLKGKNYKQMFFRTNERISPIQGLVE